MDKISLVKLMAELVVLTITSSLRSVVSASILLKSKIF